MKKPDSYHNKIRLFLLIPSLKAGGAERVMSYLAKYLNKEKFDIDLILIDAQDSIFIDEIPNHVNIISLGAKRVRFALFKLIQLFWQEKPDIVLSMLSHLNLAIGIIRPILPSKIKFIARNTVMLTKIINNKFEFFLYKLSYSGFNHVICQSEEMKSEFIHKFHIPPQKLTVIYNPIDYDRIMCLSRQQVPYDFNSIPHFFDPSYIRLVSVGRLEFQKGFDLLIRALYLSGRKDILIFIIGNGSLLTDLRELSKQLGLEKQIYFLGFQKNPYAWMSKADAFVLSSRFEGLPNVVLESLALGLPVISTPSPGGVVEILRGIDGCVITRDISAESIAEALQTFNPAKKISSEVIERFSVHRIIPEYEQLIEKLVCF
ncbi:glycosyltransferase [Thermoflavifilum thermophilum]|uniref:Glycosyltransferase involved in cell wall bisynthesis n=1 Tax=Thermoflavifilum thermophilum TaxID=1393122 RepID=A0A1I7MY83_9BACT|nr:glycosyltransferase [Thermoflavifilum thermophilum]SFV27371.1 Glycosyltransferase involved in cell wall bisynthesis [Thermoflavifilum thermophilum]